MKFTTFAALCLFFVTLNSNANDSIGVPSIWPDLVNAPASEVLVSAEITSTNVVHKSVLVQHVDGLGEVVDVLGKLNDEGKFGDEIANDGVFAGLIAVSGDPDTSLSIRVSAAFAGPMPRTHSITTDLHFVSPNIPASPAFSSEFAPITDPNTFDEMDCDRVNVLIDSAISSYELVDLVAGVGGEIEGAIPGLQGGWQISFNCLTTDGIKQKVSELLSQPGVVFAEPNFYADGDSVVSCSGTACSSQQWGREIIRVQEVENRYLPLRSIGVGVIDSGAPDNHPDLSISSHFGPYWYSIKVGDPKGHGTGVAGIIGATSYNGKGINGSCPNCKIISGRVPTNPFNGKHSSSDIASVINRVASSGLVKVLNISLGRECKNEGSVVTRAMSDAVTRYGITVVKSAGNDGWTGEGKVPSIPGVIYVGAFDKSEHVSQWSQFGFGCFGRGYASNIGADWVSVYAPGGTGPRDGGDDIFTTEPGGNYVDDFSGTSAAAPFVTSVVAMMLGGRRNLTPQQISTMIRQSSVPFDFRIGDRDVYRSDYMGATIYRVDALNAYRAPIPEILIDGNTDDWSNVDWFFEYNQWNMELGGYYPIKWKVTRDDNYLYLLRKTAATPDGGQLRIDADNDLTTGGCTGQSTELSLIAQMPQSFDFWPYFFNGDAFIVPWSDTENGGCGGDSLDNYRVVWKSTYPYTEFSIPLEAIKDYADGSRYIRFAQSARVSDPFRIR